MKAAQAVITPKPMPKAKASLGVSKRPKLYDLKQNRSPVVNINIFGGLPGSGAASSSGAWACILFYVFSWSSVLQVLALFF